MLCAIARNLDEHQVDEIRALKEVTGLTLVAFACRSLDPKREERLRRIEAELGPPLQNDPAAVSHDQLTRIRRIEGELGLSLIAVEA